jgi:ABC-type sugar transport system ATPase subunit
MSAVPETTPVPVAAVIAVSKAFGATQALESVDFSAYRGEIHALLGENGAGKSTLASILSGSLLPDSGRIELRGSHVVFASVGDALRHGVAIVHQELALMPHLTVEQNLSLGLIAAGEREPSLDGADGQGRPTGGRKGIAERVGELIRGFSLEPYAKRRVGGLSQAVRQVVEIARSLGLRAELIVLDEPTAALPSGERQDLYERLAVLRNLGIAVVLITHNLDEALAVSDRITVLRDGRRVETVAAREVTVDRLIEMMTGRMLEAALRERRAPGPETGTDLVLEVKGLACEPVVKDVSFTLGRGEIIGLAGLMGSGRTETLEAIFGLRPRNRGSVSLLGQIVRTGTPRRSLSAGMALLPEDRQGAGLFPSLSVAENMAIGAIAVRRGRWRAVVTAAGRLRRRGIDALARQLIDEVDIVVGDVRQPVSGLSGGNQQKALLARLLATSPRVLLADEPTRGVSVGSRAQIYEVVRRLADSGMSICIASSDLDELVTLCERAVLLVQGRAVETISVRGMSGEELLESLLKVNRDVPLLAGDAPKRELRDHHGSTRHGGQICR